MKWILKKFKAMFKKFVKWIKKKDKEKFWVWTLKKIIAWTLPEFHLHKDPIKKIKAPATLGNEGENYVH